jgi:hypothetical protein
VGGTKPLAESFSDAADCAKMRVAPAPMIAPQIKMTVKGKREA